LRWTAFSKRVPDAASVSALISGKPEDFKTKINLARTKQDKSGTKTLERATKAG